MQLLHVQLHMELVKKKNGSPTGQEMSAVWGKAQAGDPPCVAS